jgi:ribosomal protein S18 acetylase RimI-like enzyme
MEICRAGAESLTFLERMLFEAFFWAPRAERPAFAAFRSDPEFVKLLAGWGRRGDLAVLAEDGGTPIGAAWYRLWTPELHSYGFVDAATPELAIGVAPEHRSKRAGRRLLDALIAEARREGHPALSLSVSPENFARRLYESAGFTKVGESGTSWTMLLALRGSAGRL